MPHAIIEFTSNLDGHIDRQELVAQTHQAAMKTGIFPLGGIRVRLHELTHFMVADGHADNGFIHVHIRIGHGRDEKTRRMASETVFTHLAEWLAPIFDTRPFGLSVEVNEIPPETNFKKSNLHDYVAQREIDKNDGEK